MAGKKKLSGGALMILFSTTIFVSAALLFLVEPMFAKFVLPLFGSTPAVWTGSMMFFQAGLLTSYLYVHATTTWLGARRQAVIHLVLVLLPLLVLPLAVPEGWTPPADSNPIFYLLGLLLVAVGLPFFAISATNPLIQRWLSDTDHPDARDPYFLYRASNLGSVIGLLGYPLLVEPNLRLANQGILWSVAYGLFIVLVFASAVMLWRSAPTSTAPTEQEESEELAAAGGGAPNPPVAAGGGAPETGAPLRDSLVVGLSSSPTLLRRLRWVALAFVPSSLMLGVTAFITTDITPVPLLWVIPLSLYLFSFVIIFSRSQTMPDLVHKVMVGAFPVVMSLLVINLIVPDLLRNTFWLLVLLHLLGFFVAAMVLHGELGRDRPPARYLTEFYLWVAFGGVLGGVFNALIAPVAFDTVVEYPLAIVLACLLVPGSVLAWLMRRDEGRREEPRPPTTVGRLLLDPRVLDLALPIALGVAVVALGRVIDVVIQEDMIDIVWQTLLGMALGVCLYFAYGNNRSVRFGLGIAALIVAGIISSGTGGDVLYQDRSFFGVYRVSGDEGNTGLRTLSNGSTNHGAQLLGQTPPEPITYYHRTGPIGQLLDALPTETRSAPVAAVGLGTGSIACHAQPGQQMTFYEIDPLVEQIARDPDFFSYLRDCPGEHEVVLGDARLQLDDAPDGEYGVIVADAFSSDAIPVHLMTREAIDLYLDKLREDGTIAIHISNRHLELEPVLGDLARDRGLACYAQFDVETEDYPGKFASHWVTMAGEPGHLGGVPNDGRWQPCATNPDSDRVWSDDFSNLLGTLNWG